MDTLRDYIYVDDAAMSALHWMDAQQEEVVIRVIASGEITSLARMIALMQDIARTRIPLAYGFHASAIAQAKDIRLSPDTDFVTATMRRTPLPVGVKEVYQDILNRHQQGTHA
jgi:nucleoside-diphosphate-sugar epimerase